MLAFSGGAQTSAGIGWLKEHHGAEVVAVTLDLGQGGDLEAVRDRALALGAARAHVLDLREEFARAYILPAFEADALYEDRYRSSRARLAAHRAEARSRSPTSSRRRPSRTAGNTAAGMPSELERHASAPPARSLDVIALPSSSTRGRVHSVDANLWGRSIDCTGLDDPWSEPPEDIYTLTKTGPDCPDEPAYVELDVRAGRAGRRSTASRCRSLDLIGSLRTIAGAHGVGRLDLVENRPAGQLREVDEAPRPSSSTPATGSCRSSPRRAISIGSRGRSACSTPT